MWNKQQEQQQCQAMGICERNRMANGEPLEPSGLCMSRSLVVTKTIHKILFIRQNVVNFCAVINTYRIYCGREASERVSAECTTYYNRHWLNGCCFGCDSHINWIDKTERDAGIHTLNKRWANEYSRRARASISSTGNGIVRMFCSSNMMCLGVCWSEAEKSEEVACACTLWQHRVLAGLVRHGKTERVKMKYLLHILKSDKFESVCVCASIRHRHHVSTINEAMQHRYDFTYTQHYLACSSSISLTLLYSEMGEYTLSFTRCFTSVDNEQVVK